MNDLDYIKQELNHYGQAHLLNFWDDLNQTQQVNLLTEIKNLNLKEVTQYFADANQSLKAANDKIDDLLEPLPAAVCGSVTRCSVQQIHDYYKLGLEKIGDNQVAVLLLAGGQGTRLGVDYPKGMYSVGLASNKTLYQLQAERILKVQQLVNKKCSVIWYIMTSEHTKQQTEKYFEENNFFGLDKENVVIFEQFLLPSMTFDGKIIKSAKDKLALSPDGNGGLYRALRDRHIFEDMEKRNIKYIHVYCVDNILVKMADPVFIGYCVSKGADCGAKVVEKAFPTEAVGVVCKVGGNYQVVEYSEITLATAEKRNDDGRLMFSAGNICNHFFTTEFLHKILEKHEPELKHHVAKKKITCIDEKGNQFMPTEPNGIKMEKFVFDVFRLCDNFAVWEVLREDEFAPLKNAEGKPKDTPSTCLHALHNLHHRYVLNAGGKFIQKNGTPIPDIPSKNCHSHSAAINSQANDCDDSVVECEISPLVSYAGEGLEKLVKGKSFVPPLLINEDRINDV